MEGVKLGDLVEFRGGRLYSGAIDLDWCFTSPAKAQEAAKAYLFHSKAYHVGSSGQSGLTDTVTFSEFILDSLLEGKAKASGNVILGIAGYGAGKSHLALTLFYLLSAGKTDIRREILANIGSVDQPAARRIEGKLASSKPYLVVPINGMKNQSLFQIVFDAIDNVLGLEGVSKSCLLKYDPETAFISSILPSLNREKVSPILHEAGLPDIDDFNKAIDALDYEVIAKVKAGFVKYGIPIQKLVINESAGNLISDVSSALCGEGKPYQGMLVAFDEFGKYLSFAAEKEQTAGMGCMQDLYSGIQKSENVVLLGLSQLELRNYGVSLGDTASINNFNRYVTRFNMAKVFHLSICFESLIANLLKVKNAGYIPNENGSKARILLSSMHQDMLSYFPAMKSISIWSDYGEFSRVIFRGCWPLSPFVTWLVSFVTSQNTTLQQRTGLSLLNTLITRSAGQDYTYNPNSLGLPAVDLYDAGLDVELQASERLFSNQKQDASVLQDVIHRYGAQLSSVETRVLKAIVLASKLGAYNQNEEEARKLLQYLTGESKTGVSKALDSLSVQYNVVRYDNRSKLYEIISNGISLAQFTQELNKNVQSLLQRTSYEEQYNNAVNVLDFSEEMISLRTEQFPYIACSDFTDRHKILSLEWRFDPVFIAGYDYGKKFSELLSKMDSTPRNKVSEAKGTFVYIILPFNVDPSGAVTEISQILDSFGKTLPVMAQILPDENHRLLESFAAISILNGMGEKQKAEYGALIKSKTAELRNIISSEFDRAKEARLVIKPEGFTGRIGKVASDLFEHIYPKAISLNCDGFGFEKSTAIFSIQKFINAFAQPGISWSLTFLAMKPAEINRAKTLLNTQGWGCFDSNGSIARYPGDQTLADVFRDVDGQLAVQKGGVSLLGLMEKLMAPPYGMSTIGATLAVMVFLNARTNDLDLQDGQQKQLLPLLVDKKYFDSKSASFALPKIKNLLMIQTVKDGGKWYELLTKIDSSDSSDDLALYAQEMDTYINVQHLQIPAVLTTQYTLCSQKISNNKNLNEQFSEVLDKYEPLVGLAMGNIDFGSACKGISPILEAYDTSFPTLKPLSPLYDRYRKIKNGFVQFCNAHLKKWMAKHEHVVLEGSEREFGGYVETYQAIVDIYRILAGADKAEKIQKDLEWQEKKRMRFQAFMKVFAPQENQIIQISTSTGKHGIGTLSIAKEYMNQLSKLEQSLSGLRLKNTELPEARAKIDSSISECKRLEGTISNGISSRNEEYKNLKGASLSDIADIRNVQSKVASLAKFYNGEGPEGEQLELISEGLAALEKVYTRIQAQPMTPFEIDEMVAHARSLQVVSRIKQIDIARAAVTMGEKAKRKYKADADSWVSRLEDEVESLSDVDSAKRLQYKIEQCPGYVRAAWGGRINVASERVESFISSKKVAYAVSLYSELSDSEKAEFLRQLGIK